MTRTRPGRLVTRRNAAVAGVVLAAGLALAGCSPHKAGAAAVIGNQRITEATVQNEVRATSAELVKAGAPESGVQTTDLARDVLELQIDKTLYTAAGHSLGISVSPGDVSKFRAQTISRLGGMRNVDLALVNTQDKYESLPPSALNDYLYVTLIYAKLSSAAQANSAAVNAAYEHALKTVKVVVNPRYGRFDETGAQISDAQPAWLRSASGSLTSNS